MSYEIKAGDLDPPITDTLLDQDNAAVSLAGASVSFKFRLRGTSTWTTAVATVTDSAAGTVSYRFTSGQTDAAGAYEYAWVKTTSGNPRTFPSGTDYPLFYINE
jgi:hypothetical protein